MTNTAFVVLDSVSAAIPVTPLADVFDGSSRDASKWSTFTYEGGTGSVTEGGGDLSVALTNTGVIGVWSNSAYDLTGSQEFVELVATAPGAFFDLVTAQQDPFTGISTLHKLETIIGSNVTFGYYNGASAWTALATVTYDATAMKHLRYREAAGVVYWETSPDGFIWTTRASAANPFSLTALYTCLGTEGGIDTADFSNFNTPELGPAIVSASAVILSPEDAVVSELSVQAAVNYGDNSHDIRDAVETALRTAAGDSSLRAEFVS